MSKRITLTDFEIEQLVKGLKYLREQSGLRYEVIKVGQRFYDELIAKLEDRHRRSVETLGLSGHGDTNSIPEEIES